MKNENLLDDQFIDETRYELGAGEKVVWEGKPRSYFSVALLEIFGPYDALGTLTIYQGIMLVVVYNITRQYYFSGRPELSVLALMLGLIAILAPDVLKNIRKWKTRYIVTNQRVLIQTWRFGRKKAYQIPVSQITRFTYQEFINGAGCIYFFTLSSPPVRTRDFFTGARRHHPTFELVDSVREVYETLRLQLGE